MAIGTPRDSPRSRDLYADDRPSAPRDPYPSGGVAGPANDYYNPYVLQWLRDSQLAQRPADPATGRPYSAGWEPGRGPCTTSSADSSQREDDSVPSSEPSVSIAEGSDMGDEMDVDVLKRKIYDMGKQIWQMKTDHEQEKRKLKFDYESRLNSMQIDCDVKINDLREELKEKEKKLSATRRRSVQLEVQVEELQLQMHDLVIKQYQHANQAEDTSKLRTDSNKSRFESRAEPHRPKSDSCRKRIDPSRSRMMHAKMTSEEPEMPDSCRSRSLGSQDYHHGYSSCRNGTPVHNSSQGSSTHTYSGDEGFVPPKHLQQFSPLMMGRRTWSSSKRGG